MIIGLTAGQTAWFLIEMALMFAGIFLIAVITPKLAKFIDGQRAKNKDPYESAPLPERVDDEKNENINAADVKYKTGGADSSAE